jgi:hypothetical protein
MNDEAVDLMASSGIFFDPNLSTTYHYLAFRSLFLSKGNYTEERSAEMKTQLPIRIEMMRRALKQNLKIVFGTVAVAAAHWFDSKDSLHGA